MTSHSENRHQPLIEDLSSKLEPVRSAHPPGLIAVISFAASILLLAGLTYSYGPLMPERLSESRLHSLIAPEFLFALLAGISGSLAAHADSVPGTPMNAKIFQKISLFFSSLLILYLLFQVFVPLYPYSDLGKRPHCGFESFLYPFVPAMITYTLIFKNRLFAQPIKSSMIYGLAIGIPMATIMQIFCMYEPVHAISYHLLPALVFVITVSGISYQIWRRNISEIIKAKRTQNPKA